MARRKALHFLLHHIPSAAVPYPQLTTTLATQSAFLAVSHALAKGDLAVLDDAHFFLPPLCSLLAQGGPLPQAAAAPGAAAGLVDVLAAESAGQALPGAATPALYAPAYAAALQLACMLVAGDAAALCVLLGAAGEDAAAAAAGAACEACVPCAAGADAALVRAAVEAAAARASCWKCMPALWQVGVRLLNCVVRCFVVCVVCFNKLGHGVAAHTLACNNAAVLVAAMLFTSYTAVNFDNQCLCEQV